MRRFAPLLGGILVLLLAIGLPTWYVIKKQNSLPEVENERVTRQVTTEAVTENESGDDKGKKDKDSKKDDDSDSSSTEDEIKKLAGTYLTHICNVDFESMKDCTPDALLDLYNESLENTNYMKQLQDILDTYKGFDIDLSGKIGDIEKIDDNTVERWNNYGIKTLNDNRYNCSEIYQIPCDLTVKVSYRGQSNSQDSSSYLYAFKENGEWKMHSAALTFDKFVELLEMVS